MSSFLEMHFRLFCEKRTRASPKFEDIAWLCDLAFLVDCTQQLNELDVHLRGKDVLVADLLARLNAFECKGVLAVTEPWKI